MKRFLLILICTFFIGADLAQAEPVFSASLGGGGVSYTNRGVRQSIYRPSDRRYVAPVAKTAPKPPKKIVLKYAPEQIELTDEQMESLMPLIKRAQEGKVKYVEVIGIDKKFVLLSARQRKLGRMFDAYIPNLKRRSRHITGPAVLKSNDHTVEIVEYR